MDTKLYFTQDLRSGVRIMILPEASVLDWTQWSDQTIQDILDYTYCDNVIFLEDESYDDIRTIKLMSAAATSLLITLCLNVSYRFKSLKTKDRFILPLDSIPVLTAV